MYCTYLPQVYEENVEMKAFVIRTEKHNCIYIRNINIAYMDNDIRALPELCLVC